MDGKYVCNIKLFNLDIVANTEKKVPREWINAAGNGIEQGFIDYALPLIQGETKLEKEDSLPRFAPKDTAKQKQGRGVDPCPC